MSKEFENLLEQYWDLAYLEGKSGISQGDKANEVLHALRKLAEQPAQRKPLTDEQIRNIWSNGDCFEEIAFARAIEAAHGITGE